MSPKTLEIKIKEFLQSPTTRWSSMIPIPYATSEEIPTLDYIYPLRVDASNFTNEVVGTLCEDLFSHRDYSVSLVFGHTEVGNRNILLGFVQDLLEFFSIKTYLPAAKLVVLKETTPGNWAIEDTDVTDDYKLHRFIGTLETGQVYYGYEMTYNNTLFFLFREQDNSNWGLLDPTTHTIIHIHQTKDTGFVVDEITGEKIIRIIPTGTTTPHDFHFVTRNLLTQNQELRIESTNQILSTYELSEDQGTVITATIFLVISDYDEPETDAPIILPESNLAPSHVYSPVIQNDKYVISAVSDQNVFHMSDYDAGNLVKNSFEVVPPSISNGDYLAFGSTVPLKGIQEQGNVFGNVFSAFNAAGVGMTRGVCFYTYVSKNTYFANANPRTYVLTEDDSFVDKVIVSSLTSQTQPQAGQFLFGPEDDLDPTRNHKDININASNEYVAIAFSGGQLLRIMDGSNNIRNNFLPRVDQPFVQRVLRGTIYNIFVSQSTYNIITSWTIFY